MKILFIVPYPTEGPSNRFRIEQYLPYLQQRGITYSLRPFYNSHIYRVLYKKGYYLRKILFLLFFLLRRIYDVFTARSYDAVFIHREAYPFSGFIFERLFRFFGKYLIYDFDDSVFLKKPKKIKKIISISDCVVAGNEFLKNYASRYNKNVVALPTCIDTQIYKPRIKVQEDKVIIGWIGTFFTAVYLDLLKDVYATLANKYKNNIEFRIVGGHFQKFDLPAVYKEWSLATEIGELRNFDIGVMPLFDDDWTRGKCAFKIIQYMAVGIPSIASKVGANAVIIDDGKDGFLVSTKEDWINRLSLLIEDKNLRENMGKLGRIKAERTFSIQSNKEKFIGILKNGIKSEDSKCAQSVES